MTAARLIAIIVFSAWTIAAAAVATVFIVWLINIEWSEVIDEPIEIDSVNGEELATESVFSLTGLSCVSVGDLVHVSGTVSNLSDGRTRGASVLTHLNALDGTELRGFRGTTVQGLSEDESAGFEMEVEMQPGAHMCEVEMWVSGSQADLRGERFALIRAGDAP